MCFLVGVEVDRAQTMPALGAPHGTLAFVHAVPSHALLRAAVLNSVVSPHIPASLRRRPEGSSCLGPLDTITVAVSLRTLRAPLWEKSFLSRRFDDADERLAASKQQAKKSDRPERGEEGQGARGGLLSLDERTDLDAMGSDSGPFSPVEALRRQGAAEFNASLATLRGQDSELARSIASQEAGVPLKSSSSSSGAGAPRGGRARRTSKERTSGPNVTGASSGRRPREGRPDSSSSRGRPPSQQQRRQGGEQKCRSQGRTCSLIASPQASASQAFNVDLSQGRDEATRVSSFGAGNSTSGTFDVLHSPSLQWGEDQGGASAASSSSMFPSDPRVSSKPRAINDSHSSVEGTVLLDLAVWSDTDKSLLWCASCPLRLQDHSPAVTRRPQAVDQRRSIASPLAPRRLVAVHDDPDFGWLWLQLSAVPPQNGAALSTPAYQVQAAAVSLYVKNDDAL